MKRARVAYRGEITSAIASDRGLTLADGRLIQETEAVFLTPILPRTTFALGLNYAAHQSELGFKPPEKPLIFLKGPNTFIGHRGTTPRPHGASFMHYECELGVVIGRGGKSIARADAMSHVGGYTIANDYVTRDLIENYYRPNLRAKNRDRSTPLGPYLVDASDIADPHKLAMRTYVNGVRTQEGNTSDMIFDIPFLIAYLSEFMTLSPGDVILTGTPEGVKNVEPGDEITCEIEGLGRLMNYIVEG